MRKAENSTYESASYLAFRAAINPHMSDRGFDLFRDEAFKRSTEVFDGVLKRLKREGLLKPVKHKDFILDDDTGKIMHPFNRTNDTITLLHQVWFFLMLHFGFRGREVQAK